MDISEIRKSLMIVFIVILSIAWLFSIKSFHDIRSLRSLSLKVDEISEKLDDSVSTKDFDRLFEDMTQMQQILTRKAKFPKIFFFFFLLVITGISWWGASLLSKIKEAAAFRSMCSLRFIASLVTFLVCLLIFIQIEYQNVYRSGWVYFLLAVQWILIAASALFSLSDRVYKRVMGMTKDKNLIDGAPPPAWD